MTVRFSLFKWLVVFAAVVPFLALPAFCSEILFEDDFESGWGYWSVGNGVWQIGMPTTGPTECHSGDNCAATYLDSNYPDNTNTILESPYIVLPSLSYDKIRLHFWHWFRINKTGGYPHGPDYSYVYISVDGGSWQQIPGSNTFSGISERWTQNYVDLTEYAGSTIRFGFRLLANGKYTDVGHYIDDVSIIHGPVPSPFLDDFESGPGDWSVTNGVWQVGTPTAGPPSCPSGVQCAGTYLGGNYPDNSETRFVSPEVVLTKAPGAPVLQLRFWHWFQINKTGGYPYGPDYGYVQVSVDHGSWETVAGAFNGTNAQWNPATADLTQYSGLPIRIAFYLTANGKYADIGWYVDDIEIIGEIPPPLTCDTPTISGAIGGTADFHLDAGQANANRQYILLGSISGTFPGTPLPSGLILPINWDLFFTPIVIEFMNTVFFQNFMGTLNSNGQAQATFDTLKAIPGAVGFTLSFAYTLGGPQPHKNYDYVSNPVYISILE